MRILVTGSRDWTDRGMILKSLVEHGSFDHNVTLISGACPTGADAIAEDIAQSLGWNVERHPANWEIGKRAGYIRNKAMVDTKPDIVLAFIKNNSRGASMTANLAKEAGLKVIRYEV